MIPIKVLSQQPVLESSLFSVVETKLTVKGLTRTHHNILRRPIVSVFPLTEKNELYLIKQYRYLHEEVFLEEPAGHIDPGEKPLVAAKRELQEEVGISARKWKQFAHIVGSASVIKTQIYLFLAKELSFGKAHPEDDEEITLTKMPLEKAVGHVLSGKIKNSVAALGILMVDAMRQRGEL